MPIPRLKPDDVAVLVIDVQERLMPTIADRDRLAANCAILLRTANELALPSLVTEQYVQGLGRTVPLVSQAMTNPAARLEKTRFSAAVEMVVDQFRLWRRTTILIGGIEAHVCVLQTVLGLLRGGRTVFLVLDAIGSQRPRDLDVAVRRALGAGAIPATTESVAFELLGTASDPRFRDVLPLITAELAADGVREPAASPLAVEDGDP